VRSRTDCRAGAGPIDESSDLQFRRLRLGVADLGDDAPVTRRYAFGGDGIFVKFGCYLRRSLSSPAELVCQAGNGITLIGVDTCRGSGPEAQRDTDAHRPRCCRAEEPWRGCRIAT
jgi:hypothetical protein